MHVIIFLVAVQINHKETSDECNSTVKENDVASQEVQHGHQEQAGKQAGKHIMNPLSG